MLAKGKCKRVIVSDISQKCLAKAQELLKPFIEQGVAEGVVSDGFEKVPECDVALIAGMGGEEICSILDRAFRLPNTLVLQPMKNCDKVRVKALEHGYKFESDSLFESAGKFYDLMVLTKGQDSLTEQEILFGRDNVLNSLPPFKKKISIEISKIKERLANERLSDSIKEQMLKHLESLQKYV
jgi:tRNA (adenine22-N1)-methyltransferase